MIREFIIDDPKPSYAQWFAEIDLSAWLGSEVVDSVSFSAKRIDDGVDVSSTLLDSAKNTYTSTTLKPFIRGGESGSKYLVTIKVTTNTSEAVKEEFYIALRVQDK